MHRLIEVRHDAVGIFRDRPNRFLTTVDIVEPHSEKDVPVHLHDPGRLKELLYPGNRVLLKRATNPGRKTKWDLIAAHDHDSWVFTHSGYHRGVAEAIFWDPGISPIGKIQNLKAEVKSGHSQLDFLATRADGSRVWIETKGCTLAVDGVALFPDAPTERGARHVRSLVDLKKQGEEAVIILLVFRNDAVVFMPNSEMDPAFAESIDDAVQAGVQLYPLLLDYRDGAIWYDRVISYRLTRQECFSLPLDTA